MIEPCKKMTKQIPIKQGSCREEYCLIDHLSLSKNESKGLSACSRFFDVSIAFLKAIVMRRLRDQLSLAIDWCYFAKQSIGA